jgi:hypothetical protein
MSCSQSPECETWLGSDWQFAVVACDGRDLQMTDTQLRQPQHPAFLAVAERRSAKVQLVHRLTTEIHARLVLASDGTPATVGENTGHSTI